MPVDVRARRRLVELAKLETDTDPATINLTQEDDATMAGTTRATLNAILKEEERRGIRALSRGRIVVKDRTELSRRAK